MWAKIASGSSVRVRLCATRTDNEMYPLTMHQTLKRIRLSGSQTLEEELLS